MNLLFFTFIFGAMAGMLCAAEPTQAQTYITIGLLGFVILLNVISKR